MGGEKDSKYNSAGPTYSLTDTAVLSSIENEKSLCNLGNLKINY